MEDDVDLSFRINKDFATKYEQRKQTEELGLLEDKYREKLKRKGVAVNRKEEESQSQSESETDSESDVEEDEEGELITPAVDAQILKTIASIKAHNPTIYKPDTQFFDEAELNKAQKEWREKAKSLTRNKPMTLKDYQREQLIKQAGGDGEHVSEPVLTHVEEQAELKRAFKSAARKTVDEDGEEDFLRMRPRNEDELRKEDEDYKSFLLENLAQNDATRETMTEWFQSRPKQVVTNDEQFLINYVLNRGWIDKDRKNLPSYDRVIAEDEADEGELEKMEEFEAGLNFRFEHPEGSQIVTHTRTIQGSMRRDDNKRKQQRDERKARKDAEKQHQREELKRLKNLKKQEIQEKLKKIQEISGSSKIGMTDFDFDSDYDPEEHEKRMAKLFDQDFYSEKDSGKPVFSDSDGDFGEPALKPEILTKASKSIEKALKRSAKSAEDPSGAKMKKKFTDYLDEYYQLDYEDMVDDLPCRFKYQPVAPANFGLDTADILAADDSALNSHISLKKLAPYRPREKQQEDVEKYSKKRRVFMFRQKLREQEAGHPSGSVPSKKHSLRK